MCTQSDDITWELSTYFCSGSVYKVWWTYQSHWSALLNENFYISSAGLNMLKVYIHCMLDPILDFLVTSGDLMILWYTIRGSQYVAHNNNMICWCRICLHVSMFYILFSCALFLFPLNKQSNNIWLTHTENVSVYYISYVCFIILLTKYLIIQVGKIIGYLGYLLLLF